MRICVRCACKMLGAVYRSWFMNVPSLKMQFAKKARISQKSSMIVDLLSIHARA